MGQQDTDAYIFKQTVNLDFDIIDVTFSTGETDTVIPVVSNPTDITFDGTPPVNTTSDEEPLWLKRLKAAVFAILIVIILVIFGPLIVRGIKLAVKIIACPFKAIAASIQKRRKK